MDRLDFAFNFPRERETYTNPYISSSPVRQSYSRDIISNIESELKDTANLFEHERKKLEQKIYKLEQALHAQSL